MIGRELVRPLEDDWRETLDAVASTHAWPTSREAAKLGALVAELSAAYNDPARAKASAREAGAARLGFSFPRDVPKGAAAVRELVAMGRPRGSGTWRVLDVGAGLGATTWGAARALEAAGARGVVEATWIDTDAAALGVAAAMVRARAGRGPVEVRARTLARPVAALHELPRFDLVLAGQLLSELDVGVPEDARVDRHAALLGGWLERHVEPDGALVVVEPALRDRSRHLHRVRDALAASGATVFAPCLHAAPCPALARDADWCHEDLGVDLPPWLVPVARAAGLRREGLTFSYLVLRRDGLKLAHAARLRVVSSLLRTKGKREAFLCGELAGPAGPVAARVRVTRLDRDASDANRAWGEVGRGDLLDVDPAVELEPARIGPCSRVALATRG